MKSEIVDRSRRCSNLRLSFFGRSIIRSSGLVVILILGFFASPVQAQDAQFANANQDYAQGYFKEAVDGYNQLVRSGHWTANLFYDLGNAYFRMGDPGHAVLNYERALALDGHHPEADANLRIVRDEARALELTPGWVERYLRFATVNQLSVASAVALWVGIFCIVVLIFSRRRSVALIALSVISLLVAVAAIFALYQLDTGSNGRALAIVTARGVEARLATADNANSVLALPPGSEIKILSTRGDWVYAALPNNLRGWIPAKSAELVRL
jgi:tetratricopeptide (TPR) repeat protein